MYTPSFNVPTDPGALSQFLFLELQRLSQALQQKAPVHVLKDAATIAVDASKGDNFRVVLTGNRTLANPTNLTDGQQLVFRIKQDGSGSRTLAYGDMYVFPGGSVTLTTAANATDVLSCQYDAADNTLACVLDKAFYTVAYAAPGVGSLSITGHAPTVNIVYSASPSRGSLTLTGYAPTVA